MLAFIEAIVQNATRHCPSVEELRIRLYAGWVDPDGNDTPAAVWARSYLPRLPKRLGAIRLSTKLAQDIACRPATRLHGTLSDHGQKMVDGMIIIDTLHYIHNFGSVILVSDDEDFSPAMMAAAAVPRTRANLFWYRKRSLGQCSNDFNIPSGEVLIEILENRP